MPLVHEQNAADRAAGIPVNTHPRLEGDMILQPDDILEGKGDFIHTDGPDEEPVGFNLGQVDKPDGRHVYIGLAADSTTKQTHRELSYARPSHMVNYPIVDSTPPPSAQTPMLAPIPQPETPKVKAISAGPNLGYVASTPQSPHYYAYVFITPDGRMTPYCNPVPFQLANGQSARVPIPQETPEGINLIGLLMAEPGTSRPGRPGTMKIQRIINRKTYALDTYDLNGPYRNGDIASSTINQTSLEEPDQAWITRHTGPYGAKVARYYARITWTDKNNETIGETLLGDASGYYVEIFPSDRYTIMEKEGTLHYQPGGGYVPSTGPQVAFLAGEGCVEIERPRAPKGATGWRCYLYIEPTAFTSDWAAGWRRCEDRYTGKGGDTPFPISRESIRTSGWEGTEQYYGFNDHVICLDATLPTANTTGIDGPEETPEPPTPFGSARPEADTYYVKVTDVLRGIESLPSKVAQVTIAADEIFSVVFVDPTNRFANTTFIETDSAGDPLYHTVDRTNGFASVEGNEFKMGTTVSGATSPKLTLDAADIDITQDGFFLADFSIKEPQTGTFAGSLELVLSHDVGTGTPTEVILATKTLLGDYEEEFEILASAWPANTVSVQLIYRLSGGTRNASVHVRDSRFKHHHHSERAGRRRRKPPIKPRPGGIRWQDPPEPPWSPETNPIKDPDRPSTTGETVLDSADFEASIPGSWTQVATGTATVARDAAAALVGTAGARFLKSAGGTLSTALIKKTFAPAAAAYVKRHSLASYTKNRLAVQPVAGRLTLHPMQRPSDGRNFTWLEATTAAELVELTITDDPITPASASITLNTTTTALPVTGAYEVRQIVVGTPTVPGTVSVKFDGERHIIPVGGTPQSFTMKVTTAPSTRGDITITVDGVAQTFRVSPTVRTKREKGGRTFEPTTTAQIAQMLVEANWPGFRVTRVGSTLTFNAKQPGPRATPLFDATSTGVATTITVATLGTAETSAQLAKRIRNTRFDGWTTSGTGSTVTFTAAAAGAKVAGSTTTGGTGATLTLTTPTPGSIMTKTSFAAAIRALTFTGWTTGGTGAVVTFQATTAGVRQKSTYRKLTTGATGTIKTLIQGQDAAITAHARDASGDEVKRKIFAGITGSTIFNTDIQVSGAGTDRAVVSVWGSLGTATLDLLARFEDVDLTDDPAGIAVVGVAAESSSALTWELHSDALEINQHGKKFYRDHNALGEWLPQLFGYTVPSQPTRQDLFIQNGWAAVLPGATYILSAYLKAKVHPNAPVPLRPLVITAHRSQQAFRRGRGPYYELGDVTDSAGLTGRNGWALHEIVVEIPLNCHVISLRTRDYSAAELVMQEVALSPGILAKRTYLYATTGTYTATYDIGTPDADPTLAFWDRERISLTSAIQEPDVSHTIAVDYRSTTPLATDTRLPDTAAYSAYFTDPTLVPDRQFIQSRFTFSGTSKDTALLRAGSPRVEYLLKIGSRRMSTLLRGDRTELPGGAAFAKLDEPSDRHPDGRYRLPSGHLADEPGLYDTFGHLPACELVVFSLEAKNTIEKNWKDAYTAEVYGLNALKIKLASQPEFTRQSTRVKQLDDGQRRSIWSAPLAASEVTQVNPLPGSGEPSPLT